MEAIVGALGESVVQSATAPLHLARAIAGSELAPVGRAILDPFIGGAAAAAGAAHAADRMIRRRYLRGARNVRRRVIPGLVARRGVTRLARMRYGRGRWVRRRGRFRGRGRFGRRFFRPRRWKYKKELKRHEEQSWSMPVAFTSFDDCYISRLFPIEEGAGEDQRIGQNVVTAGFDIQLRLFPAIARSAAGGAFPYYPEDPDKSPPTLFRVTLVLSTVDCTNVTIPEKHFGKARFSGGNRPEGYDYDPPAPTTDYEQWHVHDVFERCRWLTKNRKRFKILYDKKKWYRWKNKWKGNPVVAEPLVAGGAPAHPGIYNPGNAQLLLDATHGYLGSAWPAEDNAGHTGIFYYGTNFFFIPKVLKVTSPESNNPYFGNEEGDDAGIGPLTHHGDWATQMGLHYPPETVSCPLYLRIKRKFRQRMRWTDDTATSWDDRKWGLFLIITTNWDKAYYTTTTVGADRFPTHYTKPWMQYKARTYWYDV